MKRFGILLAVLLILTSVPLCPAVAEGDFTFTGKVTYHKDKSKELYLQNGSTAYLVFLNSKPSSNLKGEVITVSGYKINAPRCDGKYDIPVMMLISNLIPAPMHQSPRNQYH